MIRCWGALLAPALALALLLAPARAQDAKPADLLQEAEREATRGNYTKARRIYAQVAERFPGTEESLVAARRAGKNAFLRAVPLWESGPSDRRIDITILGDGFVMDDQPKFDKWARATVEILFKVDALKRYQHFCNLRAMNILSAEDGVDSADEKRLYDTALDAKSLGGGGQVYIDTGKVMEMLAEVREADDLAIVLVQRGVLGTGGGGIATTGRPDRSTIVHEWGHAFGGLLDEYNFGSADRERGFGTRGYNISDTSDPKQVPWAHFLEKRVKGVGVVEGGAGIAKGRWRPTPAGCAMGAAGSLGGYCPVCRERMIHCIYMRCGAIDEAAPADPVVRVRPGKEALFRVKPMRVEGPPELDSKWLLYRVKDDEEVLYPKSEEATNLADVFLLPGTVAPATRSRTPLPEARGDERKGSRASDGFLELRIADLAEGTYEVQCWVEDRTPWVLVDERQLLKDARRWILEVGPLVEDHPTTAPPR